MFFKKRGQAAMEFLMTYGWAILVIIVFVTALSYFDVLRPGKLLPIECTFDPGLFCGESYINTSHFQINIINGMGTDIQIHQFRAESLDSNFTTLDMEIKHLLDGQNVLYTLKINETEHYLTPGSRVSFNMKINYTNDMSDIMHVLEGKLIDIVHER
jgi:hypothetical protein